MTRGEGILLLPAMWLVIWIREWTDGKGTFRSTAGACLRIGAGCAAIVLAWSAYAYWTFGRLTPNTLAAKQAHRLFLPHETAFLDAWPLWLRETYAGWSAPTGIPQFYQGLYWLMAAIGVYVMARPKGPWLGFLLFMAAFLAGYSMLGVIAFTWYAVPLTFVLALWVALGAGTLLEGIRRRMAPRSAAFAAVSVLLAALILVPPGLTIAARAPARWADPRGVTYHLVSDWLRENTKPGSSVSFAEIGHIGYFTENRIIDLGGLATPDLIPYMANMDTIGAFKKYRPDYHVWIEGDFLWSSIVKDPYFESHYEEAVHIYGAGSRPSVFIYARKDSATDGAKGPG